ncbi:hypothetical protein [Streptomyces sp. DW26H14]|uniref:hypothetical protein n=1 Tax=Streptomyces sp. DW26H14 TaxID=3435395 RepID=UPI00403E349F
MTAPQPDREQEIRARAEAASRGPWTLAYERCDCQEDDEHGSYVSRIDTGAGPATELSDLPREDWEFMAHAREDVPWLLAENARLRADRDAFRDQRNAVVETNGALHERVQGAAEARLRAENEVRTLTREIQQLRADRDAAVTAARRSALEEARNAVTEQDLGPQNGRTRDYEDGWWNSRHAADGRIRSLATDASPAREQGEQLPPCFSGLVDAPFLPTSFCVERGKHDTHRLEDGRTWRTEAAR